MNMMLDAVHYQLLEQFPRKTGRGGLDPTTHALRCRRYYDRNAIALKKRNVLLRLATGHIPHKSSINKLGLTKAEILQAWMSYTSAHEPRTHTKNDRTRLANFRQLLSSWI